MKGVPAVSVVIPTYNRVALLKETVASVRNQTFDNLEIIVVDDGSLDDTWEWLQGQRDIRAFKQTNKGIAAARNAGIAQARSPWIALLDHDDVWLPEKLSLQMEFVEKNPRVALVAARHIRLGKHIPKPLKLQWISGDLFADVYSKSFIHTSSVVVKKDVIESIGGFDSRYRFADEFDVWLKIARDHEIAYLNKCLVLIRFYDANTSHDRIRLRKETQDILLRHYDPEKISEQLFRRTLSDHDISYGRAYLKANEIQAALDCFWRSVTRTPFRLRSWRYFLKYKTLKVFAK